MAERGPLLWLPFGEPVPGRSGWCDGAALYALATNGSARRSWWLGPKLVGIEAEHGGYWKPVAGLPDFDPHVDPELLAALGCPHPASWGSVFRHLMKREGSAPPWLPATMAGHFRAWSGGPWSEARQVGLLPGVWWRSDLRAAYRWAGSIGLPDPRTFRMWHRSEGRRPGLWWAEHTGTPDPELPAALRDRRIVVSDEELERLPLSVRRLSGVTWAPGKPWGGPGWLDRILNPLLPRWQRVMGRAYWGAWLGSSRLRCVTPCRAWELPSRAALPPWALVIIGRVRLRVWELAAKADGAHVHVDEVITRTPPAYGDAPGDWHLKQCYPAGLEVHRTGHFGAPGARADMMTGVSR